MQSLAFCYSKIPLHRLSHKAHYMRDKIFNALKQAYSSLGLGDASLQLHAELLAGLGTVNDDNLDDVVSKQADYLKKLQTENDKRVTQAIETTRKKFQEDDEAKKKADAEKKAKEEAEAKAKAEKEAKEKEERERIAKLDGFEKQLAEFKLAQQKMQEEQQAAFEKRIEELLGKNKESEEKFAEVEKQLKAKEASEKKAARNKMILDKAKELGIKESRISEGFAIGDDMDEDGINAYLSKVANNQKAEVMPSRAGQRSMPEEKPTKDDFDAIASALIGR